MRKKIRLARAVAGLTGRIETIVVLIPRSDRRVQSMKKNTMIHRVAAQLTWRRLFGVDLPHPKGLALVLKQTAVATTLLHPRRRRLQSLTGTGDTFESSHCTFLEATFMVKPGIQRSSTTGDGRDWNHESSSDESSLTYSNVSNADDRTIGPAFRSTEL